MKPPLKNENEIFDQNPIVFLDIAVGPEKGILRKARLGYTYFKANTCAVMYQDSRFCYCFSG